MENTKKETIGQRFRSLREGLHMNQMDTAYKLGISYTLYSRIENDHKLPSTPVLIAAADLFAVSVDYLLCRSDSASATGLSPEALQVLVTDHKDIQDRLTLHNEIGLSVQGYNAEQSDLQNLAAVVNYLLTEGRANRGSGGLLDLLRAYFTTSDDAIIDGLQDGVSSSGRRGFHLDSGQVAAGMYYARIQQVLVQYRAECLRKIKKPRR